CPNPQSRTACPLVGRAQFDTAPTAAGPGFRRGSGREALPQQVRGAIQSERVEDVPAQVWPGERHGFGDDAAKHGETAVVVRIEGPSGLVRGGSGRQKQLAQLPGGRGNELPAVNDRNRIIDRETAIKDRVIPDVDRWAGKVTCQIFSYRI